MTSSNSEVLNKINNFIEYSQAQEPDYADEFETKTASLITAVNEFYSRDRSNYKIPLLNLQHNLYSYFSLKGTEFDPAWDLNIPDGVTSDLSELFYSFPLMTCSNESFFNAWEYEIDALTQKKKVKDNTLIISWLSDLETNGLNDIDLGKISALSEWIDSACTDASGILLWEELGDTVKQPNTKDIATDVFMNRKLKKCVDDLRLPVHVPSYLV